tara:strand:+ start:5734 stop:6150 length:417 start_codon:yes stop_codon:yes gene_type:complete
MRRRKKVDQMERIQNTAHQTRDWVRLTSTIIGVYAFFGAILGGALIAGVPFVMELNLVPASAATTTGIVLIVVALLGVYPAISLHRFAVWVSRFSQTGHFPDLEAGQRNQRRFWIYNLSLNLLLFLSAGVAIALTFAF